MTSSREQPFDGSQISPRHFSMRGWDLAVTGAVLLVAVLVAISLRGDQDSQEAITTGVGASFVLAAFVLLYVFWGRAGLRRSMMHQPAGRAEAWFLIALILLVGAALTVNPYLATLQTLVYPMIWMYGYGYWASVRWTALLAFVVGAVGFAVDGFVDYFPLAYAGLAFVFTVAMGTWITQIVLKGERYRELSEKLSATQAEVAAYSEAAGASAERERLSRELHDTLTQTLTGLVMLSEQAERALATADTALVRDRLARVHSAALESLTEARALVATTQPLGDGGLEAAIERVVARLRADTGLSVSCEISTLPLDRERQVILLRAVQEGLANARKHARASAVHVVLEDEGGRGGESGDRSEARIAVLRIEDDGVGPEGSGVSVSGFGLTGLSDRLRAVGGEVHFGAGSRGGARLEVRLPFAELPKVNDATIEGDPL